MSAKQRMCVVNMELIEDLAPLVGGSSDIMRTIGISWNSWVKIVAGQPIRSSMAERFKARVVDAAAESERLRTRFPSESGGLDVAALEAAFLVPYRP